MSATAPIERPTPPRFLTWLALALIFTTPGQLAYAVDPKHGPFIALADVLAVMVGGLFLLWVLFAGLPEGWPTGLRWRLSRVSWPPLPLWAWVAVAVLSGLGAESPKAAALEIIQLVLYFGVVYMLFANVLVSEPQRRQAVRVLLVATTLAVGYALFQYFTANDPLAVKSLSATSWRTDASPSSATSTIPCRTTPSPCHSRTARRRPRVNRRPP